MTLNPFAISGLILFFTCIILTLTILIYGKTKLHRLWALFNIAVGIWGFGTFLAGKATAELAALHSWRFTHVGAIFLSIFFFHVICTFCEIERPKIIIAAYLQGIFFLILNIMGLLFSKVRYVFNSFYFCEATNVFHLIFFWLWITLVLYGHYELFKYYKNVKGAKQNQALYLFLGMIIGFIGGTSSYLPVFKIDIYPVGNFAISLYCVIVTYAILRHQLMDIKVVIKKTLVYSILISILTILYLLIIYTLERIFSGIVGYRSIASTALIIAVFSILFIPLKNKIQRYIDKYFFKGSIDQIDRERTLLETELYKADRLKALSTLAAGMAHEIKNPLTSIKTFVEYVDKKHEDPAFRAKFKDIVPNEIDKITNIVNQLLDYSRTEKTSQKECNIHNILNYVLELYNNVFLKKHIKLTKLYNSKALNILCEENKIKQAFINIIMNSIEAMPKGGSITVKTEDIDNAIEISIKDTGTGIAEEHIKRLFDPFYTTKEKGTGLGLFVVHQIIRNNKGLIAIDSRADDGTTVKVRFGIGT